MIAVVDTICDKVAFFSKISCSVIAYDIALFGKQPVLRDVIQVIIEGQTIIASHMSSLYDTNRGFKKIPSRHVLAH